MPSSKSRERQQFIKSKQDSTDQKDVPHLLQMTRLAAGTEARTMTLQFGPGQKRNSG